MSDERPPNIPVWDVEDSRPDLVPALEDGLSEIVDPELGLNIIQLGLVRNIAIEDENAVVDRKSTRLNSSHYS